MTIQDLLKRVARGELSSCGGHNVDDESSDVEYQYQSDRTKRNTKHEGGIQQSESDEYYYDDIPQFLSPSETHRSEDNEPNEETESPVGLGELMDQLGDADIVICDNLEKALYLSLKYEFVTPLTSLVVVKPDSNDLGEFGEAGLRTFQVHYSSADLRLSSPCAIILLCVYLFIIHEYQQ